MSTDGIDHDYNIDLILKLLGNVATVPVGESQIADGTFIQYFPFSKITVSANTTVFISLDSGLRGSPPSFDESDARQRMIRGGKLKAVYGFADANTINGNSTIDINKNALSQLPLRVTHPQGTADGREALADVNFNKDDTLVIAITGGGSSGAIVLSGFVAIAFNKL